jgi:beta-glucanase (GH16 family)
MTRQPFRHLGPLVLLIVSLCAPAPAVAQTGLDPQWVAFNRAGGPDSHLQCYTPNNVAVSGGYLVISTLMQTATCSSWDLATATDSYTSGFVSMRSFSFLYGTVEVRAKLGGGQHSGSWPVVWLQDASCQASDPTGTDNSCNGQEIDIAEVLFGNFSNVNQQIHVDNFAHNDQCMPSVSDASQNFHVYQVVWAPGSLVFKIDGVTTCQMFQSYVPSAPMYLKFTSMVGGYGGAVDNSTLPWSSLIDYVTVTQGSTVVFSDDFNGSSSPSSTITASPSVLHFGATKAGAAGALQAVTSAQPVTVSFSGPATTWTASANQPWIQLTNASGSGAGQFSVSISDPTNVLGGASTAGGTVTITPGTPGAQAAVVSIALTIDQTGVSTTAPFGSLDTPTDGSTGLAGSIAVTGWALDDIEVSRVRITRDPVAGETPGTQIYIGDGVFIPGARPDVAAAYATRPRSDRAGWGYLLLTNFLPNQGNGTFRLSAYADDLDGHTTLLGTKTITCANSASTSPFGAIDTPGQGAVVSGVVNNFGWVLAPAGAGYADPPEGGTVRVVIDGVAVGSPSGWTSRSDLTAAFGAGSYHGLNSAAAVFALDTTALADGLHTIAWIVTDNQGATSGVGSRFFSVLNGSLSAGVGAGLRASSVAASSGRAVLGRTGFDLEAPLTLYYPDASGTVVLRVTELARVELQTDATKGYLVANGHLEPLPAGAHLAADGTFTWQSAAGFVGAYDFVFDPDGVPLRVRVVIRAR